MKTPSINSIPALSAVLLALTLQADARPPGGGPPPSPLMRALDQDRDREISSSEIQNAATALLELDEDSDGALTKEELKPKRDQKRQGRRDRDEEGEDDRRPPRPPRSALFKALDQDQSGDLSKEEILAASEVLAELDTDGEPGLSSEEAGLKGPREGREDKRGRRGEEEDGEKQRGDRRGPPRR